MTEREPPKLPARFSADFIEGGGLVVTYKWSVRRGRRMLVAAAAAPVVVGLFQFSHQGFLPLFTIGALAFTGCIMSYPAFALIRNTTRFEVGLGGLRVKHGPLPLRRSQEFARDEIADLVVRKTLTDRRESQYTLMLRRHDKRRLVPLLYEIPTRKEGLELANAIKKVLGLPTIDDDDEHDDGVPVPTATASVARG